jgi:thiol:disulfide interchange protein DsbD
MSRLALGFVFVLLATLGAASLAHAQSEEDLLPVEQAFKLSAKIAEPGTIRLHWDIAPDYYLYRSRIKAKTTESTTTLGALALPDGIQKHDEFLGDVEIYHGAIDATLPYTLADASAKTLAATITVQGCHEVDPKICYPPHPTTVTLDVPGRADGMASSAPGTAPPAQENRAAETAFANEAAPIPNTAPANTAPARLSLASKLGAAATSEPLPPEQAFVFEAIAASPTSILARWTMPKGYYLYRDKSSVKLASGDGVALGAPAWPEGKRHTDEHFGTVEVYFDEVELPIPLKRESGVAQAVEIDADYQGCQDNGICYPEMTKRVRVEMPAATADELAAADASFVPMARAAGNAPGADENALRTSPPARGVGGLFAALLFALLGGLVLNLMPCVLPVLSLKVLGVAQSGESATKARRHALIYTAGVLCAFAAVGLGVIALRTAGQALGWGFQLQQPVFVATLVYVLFAIGLSLSGVFSIGAGFAGVGQGLSSKSGAAGDFFTGVLAVVVASPCTAPFMGSALAFAFGASSLVALLVFLALGLGLALPFLAIGFVPALASRLPKPGAWMETLKQLLAFPMYLTGAWLVWVLGYQRGVDAIGWVLIGAIVLALGLWWWERHRYTGGPLQRALAIALVVLALLPIIPIAHLAAPAAAHASASDAVPYSAEKLASLRAEGRAVFVDVGADWCVTCKVNEKAVLDTDAFRDLLARSNAVLMTADWTNVDPAITAFLQQYKAVGVPLYVVFRAGESGPGHALPTVLTQAIVEEALGAKPRG